jgi:hypothetical protein
MGHYTSSLIDLSAIKYRKFLYVDPANGNDANSGLSWDQALATINQAMTLIGSNSTVRGSHFAIIYQGRLTGGNAFPGTQTVNVQGVALLGAGWLYGMGGGWDSCFVSKGSLLTQNPDLTGLRTEYVALNIQADDVLIAGLKFYAADIGNPFYHIALDDTVGGGRNCLVTQCVFQGDVNGAQNVYGVGFNGSENSVAQGNMAYYMKEAFTLGGGPTRYCHISAVQENLIADSERAISVINSSAENNWLIRNRIMQKATYGFAMVAGIDFTGSGNGMICAENYVGHGTKTTAYVKGAGTDYWYNNYYGTNVLYDGT